MMRTRAIKGLAALAGLAVSSSAMADFSFNLGNYLNVTNTWANVNLTTAAAIPTGAYSGIQITYNFDSNPNGTSSSHAWSSEGRTWFSTLGANANTNTTPSFPGGNSNYSASVLNVTGGASNATDVNGLQFNFTFGSTFNYTGAQTVIWNYRQAFGNASGQQVDWNNINVTFKSFAPPTPPAGAIDLGTLNAGGMLMGSSAYTPSTVQWYKFTIGAAIPAGELFTVHTAGNTLTGGSSGPGDTEIGLFDSNGFLLGNNDDFNFSGGDLWSYLQTTAGIPAGTYYLAASAYNLTVANGFVASASDSLGQGVTAITGNIKVTVTPAPGTAALLGLSGLVAIRRRRA